MLNDEKALLFILLLALSFGCKNNSLPGSILLERGNGEALANLKDHTDVMLFLLR